MIILKVLLGLLGVLLSLILFLIIAAIAFYVVIFIGKLYEIANDKEDDGKFTKIWHRIT